MTNPADWPRLDEKPLASAQMIEWHAPETAAMLRESDVRLAAILALHAGCECDAGDHFWCKECDREYPCQTVRLLGVDSSHPAAGSVGADEDGTVTP